MALRDIFLLIDGTAVASQNGEWRNGINPATQEVVARVPFSRPWMTLSVEGRS